MIIDLDEKWFIDADTTSVSLNERRTITGENQRGLKAKEENIGKERIVTHGFYGTIRQACDAYLQKGVASMPGMLTATQLVSCWTDMTTRVEAATRGLKRDASPVAVGHKDSPLKQPAAVMTPSGTVLQVPGNLFPLPQAAL